MTHERLLRIALGYLALIAAQLGAWALLAPQSFYDDFPGLGRTWVSVDGPFNEHLIRDVGALNLALGALLIAAAVRLSRDLVVVAATASLVWTVPHLLYHIVNTDGLASGDVAASLGGLTLSTIIPVGVLLTARKHLPAHSA